MLFTIEGVDGTGKTTLCETLAKLLPKEEFSFHREPYSKTFAMNYIYNISDPMTKLFGFMYDRALHQHVITNELKNGKHIICDRYHDSTMAYQFVDFEKSKTYKKLSLKELKDFYKLFLIPDHTYLLICPLDEIENRLRTRDNEYVDETVIQYIKDVQNTYKMIALDDNKNRFTIFNSSRYSGDQIASYIVNDIKLKTSKIIPTPIVPEQL